MDNLNIDITMLDCVDTAFDFFGYCRDFHQMKFRRKAVFRSIEHYGTYSVEIPRVTYIYLN